MALSFDLQRAVREVLSYDTSRSSSPRDLLIYLMDLLDYGEFHIVEQAGSFASGEHTNLVGLRGPFSNGGGLLLCSAMASPAPVDPSLWTETEEDPWNPTERDGLLFGHGAATGKVDLVCKILAASRIEADKLHRPVTIAGLFGEEARVAGAMHLLDSGICVPEWAMAGEPTNLELVSAHRGHLVLRFDIEVPERSGAGAARKGRAFRVEARGEPAHSACPSCGCNAIDLALGAVERMRSDGTELTVHRLEGGGIPETVPAHAVLYLRTKSDDPRFVPTGARLTVEEIEPDLGLGPALDAAIGSWLRLRPRMHELFRWTAPDTAPDFLPSTPIYSLVEAETNPSQGCLHLWLEYRTLPGQKTESLVRDVEALARRLSEGGPGISVEVERNLLPMDGDPRCHLARHARAALRRVGLPPVVGTYGGCAEGWIFEAAGIETLLFGPGDALATANRPNEHTVLLHLERATDFYEELVRRLCCQST